MAYILQLKANQGLLHADTDLLFRDLEQSNFTAYPYDTAKPSKKTTEESKFAKLGRFAMRNSWRNADHNETIRLWEVSSGTCLQTLRIAGPYAGMNITGVTGISKAQKAALKALGAVEEGAT